MLRNRCSDEKTRSHAQSVVNDDAHISSRVESRRFRLGSRFLTFEDGRHIYRVFRSSLDDRRCHLSARSLSSSMRVRCR